MFSFLMDILGNVVTSEGANRLKMVQGLLSFFRSY